MNFIFTNMMKEAIAIIGSNFPLQQMTNLPRTPIPSVFPPAFNYLPPELMARHNIGRLPASTQYWATDYLNEILLRKESEYTEHYLAKQKLRAF